VHKLPVAPNILDQDFSASAPNQAWCGDITYIATDEGWPYLAGLKDLFSGELVGYANERAHYMKKHLVMQALFRAVASPRPPAGLIHHTDRGSSTAPTPTKSSSANSACRHQSAGVEIASTTQRLNHFGTR